MPLSIRQFDLGINEDIESLMREVYWMLIRNPELAYSSMELRQAILGDSVEVANSESFGRALEVLAELRAVERRWVNNEAFYAFNREFDTEFWEPAN